MLSNVWPLPGTSFDMAFNCPPAAGSSTGTYQADENHVIVEPQVVQQLITAIACLVAVWAESTGCWRVKGLVW